MTNRPTDRQIDRVIGKFPFNNTHLQWNFVYDGDFSNMLKLHNMPRAAPVWIISDTIIYAIFLYVHIRISVKIFFYY